MGGRGGLNILPQKKWNVYNWDNRIKVSKNEDIVNNEIERRSMKNRKRKLNEKINLINSKTINHQKEEEGNEITDNEKNEIFKEIMQRQSILKRVNRDFNYENNNKIAHMNQPIDYENLKTIEEINVQFHEHQNGQTIKDTLKRNLKPWYIQKKVEDLKEYHEYKMLSSKREREKIVDQSLDDDHQNNSIKKLRELRKIREAKEHHRIISLLTKSELKK